MRREIPDNRHHQGSVYAACNVAVRGKPQYVETQGNGRLEGGG
jgi:hypothetical protein